MKEKREASPELSVCVRKQMAIPLSQMKASLGREERKKGGREEKREVEKRKLWVQPCKLQHPSLDSIHPEKLLRLLPRVWVAFWCIKESLAERLLNLGGSVPTIVSCNNAGQRCISQLPLLCVFSECIH